MAGLDKMAEMGAAVDTQDDLLDGLEEQKALQLKLFSDREMYERIYQKLRKQTNIDALQEELKNTKLSAAERADIEQELTDKIRGFQEDLVSGIEKAKQSSLEGLNLYEKAQRQKNAQEEIAQNKKIMLQKRADERAYLAATVATKEQKEQLAKFDEETRKKERAYRLEELNAQEAAINAEQEAANIAKEKRKAAMDLSSQKLVQEGKELGGAKGAAMQLKGKVLGGAAALKDKIPNTKENLKNAKAEKEKAEIERERARLAIQEAEDNGASPEELEKLQKEFSEANAKAVAAANKEAMAEIGDKIADKLGGDYKKQFQLAESNLQKYKSVIEARIQGTDKSYKKLSGKITSLLSVSPFVKSTDVLESMKEATEKGIMYNLEQRAFLNTVSDKIAATFDAFDSNLLRLIRLQQADMTASRLGMEARLTKFFNNMFNDSSYLAEEIGKSVSGAILEAQSQMDRNQASEFEYIVQKWMGSLYSVGISQSAIESITEGLNYLATGDVTSLSSNESLQTLLAMSSSKANLEYSELLLKGLDASNTNKLLASMVQYLKEIADNSENQVVRSAYKDVLGISVSDMRAISNLSQGDINSIASEVMSFSNMKAETTKTMFTAIARQSIAETMGNIYDNVLYSVATDMVNNPGTYAMQKMLDYLQENETDIHIPFINAMGFGLDLNASVVELMQMGLGIGQGMSLAFNILRGLGSGGGLSIDAWGGTEYNKRGGGLGLGTGGVLGGSSGSTSYAASGSAEDMKNSEMQSATDDAEESKEVTNKNTKSEHTFDDFYTNTIGEKATEFINVRDIILPQVFDEQGLFLRVSDPRMNYQDGNLKVVDNKMHEMTLQHLQLIELLLKQQTAELGIVRLHPETKIKLDDTVYTNLRSKLASLDVHLDAQTEKDLLLTIYGQEQGVDDRLKKLMNNVEDGGLKVITKFDTNGNAISVQNDPSTRLVVKNLVW